MTDYTPFALWPDTYMCPVCCLEEAMQAPCARSDDYQIVYVYEYDEAGAPHKWLTQYQYNKLNTE